MAITDDVITATSELSVTDGVSGPVFADFIPTAVKAYVLGKLGIGTINPQNALDVEGALAVGTSYSGSFAAPANGLIVEGNVGIGTNTPGAKLDVAGTMQVSQSAFLSVAGGSVGVGTNAPGAKLDVAGTLKVSQDAALAVAGGSVGVGTSTPGAKLDVAGTTRVSQDAFLAVSSGSVGIGTSSPLAKLQIVGGALMPSVGNTASAGIMFPQNPGGGAGDAAWIRYYVRAGESTTLEIGVSNDPDDHIALIASGNVGIGTSTPANKLDVIGDIAIQGKHAFRGSDTWLRLNQDFRFTSGVHTPGLFAPVSLNVGGASGWGNPGSGNAWITGTVGVGTTAPQRKLHVHSDDWAGGAEIHASGATAGLSFTDREVGRQWDSGGAGERWVLYSAARTARLWTSGNGDRLTVGSDGTVTVVGPYLIANGAGGERSYIGGDGWGNDVQIGSFNAGVTNVGFWNVATSTRMNLYAANYVQASDARLKKNVEPLSGALEKVLKLRGVKFDWAEGADDGARLGLIAQEVLEVVPEAVSKDGKGMYGIAYGPLVSVLVEAMKEQNSRLERLERRQAGRG